MIDSICRNVLGFDPCKYPEKTRKNVRRLCSIADILKALEMARKTGNLGHREDDGERFP